jgi:hypothetical protein
LSIHNYPTTIQHSKMYILSIQDEVPMEINRSRDVKPN